MNEFKENLKKKCNAVLAVSRDREKDEQRLMEAKLRTRKNNS